MRYGVTKREGYLLAELRGREDARDMREFLQAVKAACLEHGCPRILLSVRESNTMFKAEDYGLDGSARGYLGELVTPSCRIALLADASELHHAHEYIALVARQQQVNVRAFRDAGGAAQWLQEGAAETPPGGLDALQPRGAAKLP